VAYLLNLLYLLLLVLTGPWLLVAVLRTGKYREGLWNRFFGCVPERRGEHPCIWLHAVSVGEVNLLGPLIDVLERDYPQWECVVSTTTRTGMALARKKFAPRVVFYCPLDFSWAVRSAIRRIRPQLIVLAELELWPNLIRIAKRHGIKVAIVNGRLSERSFRGYLRFRPFLCSLFASIDVLAVQDEQYAERFRQLGARPASVHVTGSIKFDGVQTDRQNPATRRLAHLARITSDDIVMLAGSTQDPEEFLALETYQQLSRESPRLRLILVPRHPERFEAVATLLERSGIRWQRRSQLNERDDGPAARVLLVDSVGELGSWWGTAQIAFVGGSLGRRGGQNMIEPAAYGAVVSFGPHTMNFKDIVSLMLAARAAEVVRDGTELTALVRRAIEDQSFAKRLGEAAQTLVRVQAGATARTARLLDPLLGHGTDSTQPQRRSDAA